MARRMGGPSAADRCLSPSSFKKNTKKQKQKTQKQKNKKNKKNVCAKEFKGWLNSYKNNKVVDVSLVFGFGTELAF